MLTKAFRRLHTDPQLLKATACARSLWLMALSWSVDMGTGGFIPHTMLGRLLGQKRDALRLVEVGLWEHAEKDGIPGYQIVQFSTFTRK